MGDGWRIEIDTGAGFTEYRFTDHGFDLSLNQMGRAHATVFKGTTEPDEGDEIKIWWDRDNAKGQQRLWFRGIITRKTRTELRNTVRLECVDDSLHLYQSKLGNLRKWSAITPYAILTTATGSLDTTTGLRYNAQNTAVMNYATTAPNAITNVSTGNALTYRAHTGNLLIAIGRLCEQATSGGGPTYGLEWFVDRDGADARQLNVVTRRQRAAVYTAESFRIGRTLHAVPQETVRDVDYNRVKVIGEGSGTTRIESAWVGAGTREYTFSDKNVTDTTTATNLANRILNALNTGTTPRFEADTHVHDLDTDVGDDVDVVPLGGGAATTYRCFGIQYEWGRRSFRLHLGRSREFFTSILRDLDRSLDALDFHSQVTDLRPVTLRDAVGTGDVFSAPVTVTAGTRQLTSIAFVESEFGKAESFWIRVALAPTVAPDASVASHTHDMGNHTHTMGNHTHAYDKTTAVSISSENSGSAGVDPHGHTAALTHTSTATGAPSTNTTGAPSTNTTGGSTAALTINGPFVVEAFLSDGVDSTLIAEWTVGHLRAGNTALLTNTYPFAVEDSAGGYALDRIVLAITNDGDADVTLDVGSYAFVWKKALHRHNEE